MSTKYLVFMTPRSGSSITSDYLRMAGIGNPGEHLLHLNRDNIIPFSRRFDEAVKIGTANDITGIVINIDILRQYGQYINEVLSEYKFLHFRRRNVVRQAISFYKAEMTGIWHKFDSKLDINKNIEFDYDMIMHYASIIIRHNELIQEFIHKNKLNAYTLWYEDLGVDSIQNIADFLGVKPSGEIQLNSNRLRMCDEISEEWYKRITDG